MISMGQRKKNIHNLLKENAAITSMIAHKLQAIFRSTYNNAQQNCAKSKNKGGDNKYKDEKENKLRRISKKYIDNIRNELKLLLAYYGIGTPHISMKNQPKLSKEQIAIMDIDFDGLYHTPEKTSLSSSYAAAKHNASCYELSPLYKSNDYDLNQIPIWQEMKKFNSFRAMYRPICTHLAKINYNPEHLNQLNFYDILDMIAQHNRANPKQRMPSQRNVFLKTFSACYGEEFLHKMTQMGKKDEAIGLLTYIHYLDKHNGKCPKEAHDAAHKFNIHHIKNRKNAEEMEDYALVNNPANLTLCYAFPHHKILHAPVEIDLNPNIVFFGSFLQEFQIIRNQEKERLYQQGMIKDWRPDRRDK